MDLSKFTLDELINLVKDKRNPLYKEYSTELVRRMSQPKMRDLIRQDLNFRERIAEAYKNAVEALGTKHIEQIANEEEAKRAAERLINAEDIDIAKFKRLVSQEQMPKNRYEQGLGSLKDDILTEMDLNDLEAFQKFKSTYGSPDESLFNKNRFEALVRDPKLAEETLRNLKARQAASKLLPQVDTKGIASNIDRKKYAQTQLQHIIDQIKQGDLSKRIQKKTGTTFFSKIPVIGPAIGLGTALATGDASAAMPMGFESDTVGEGSDIIPEKSVYDQPTENNQMTPERFKRLSKVLNMSQQNQEVTNKPQVKQDKLKKLFE